MDITTPRNVQLSGFFLRSNALLNAKQRIPNCLAIIIDALTARKFDVEIEHGQEAAEELEGVIGKIQELKQEVLDDVPFRKLISSGPDVKFYNDYLEKMTCFDCRPTMLQTVRVYAECYVYRRVWECFELTKYLKQFDPYIALKNEILTDSLILLKKMGKYFVSMVQNPSEDKFLDFNKLVMLNLWSHRKDGPLKEIYLKDRLRNIKDIEAYSTNIICNHSKDAWALFQGNVEILDSTIIVDFILDGFGYELFQDFCLADFLSTNTPILKVRFHVKTIPWFIWNTKENDIEYFLNRMKQMSKIYIQTLFSRWTTYINNEKWQIIVRKFWSLPNNFSDIKIIDPWLYKTLCESTLIIIKGDINYQKTVGDFNWCPRTPLEKVLKNFHPTNLLFIRVLKSDIISGMNEEQAKNIEYLHKYLSKGYLGMIQFAKKTPEPKCLLD